jgi:lysine-N-methylase
MQITVPHYYKEFHCVAADCEDTCCAGWKIMIDEKSLKKYRRFSGSIGNRLRNSIDIGEGSFRQYDGRCAFLNEEGLCDIYSEAGPKMLCATCRNYPRHIEEFEGLREISLSLSCIEAARIILGCEEHVSFITKERPGSEEYPDFDFFLFSNLTLVRDAMIELLQDEGRPLGMRMGLVTALAHDFQNRVTAQKLYQTEEVIMRCKKGRLKPIQTSLIERYHIMKQMFQIFDRMEVLKKDFPRFIQDARRVLFDEGEERYKTHCLAFSSSRGYASPQKERWQQYGEQLMVYFIFTYFCGSVYDERPYEKVKLAVVSTLLIQELCMAFWLEHENRLEFSDVVNIAHRYSREIEHSDQNLDTMEEILRNEETYKLENILKVLSIEFD